MIIKISSGLTTHAGYIGGNGSEKKFAPCLNLLRRDTLPLMDVLPVNPNGDKKSKKL
jgi:hypothetical protein